MKRITRLLFFMFLVLQKPVFAQVSNIPVHDPVMIKQDSVYYLFCTGRGISMWSSKDRINWKREKPVFDTLPWAVRTIPGFRNHIWAPDISFHNGLYYLYYSVSAFGKNTSCIGVATNKTLHPGSADYKWTDHGKVIQSVPGRDMWNAIDPNLIRDEKGISWLTFGSFWDGIKLVKLNDDLKSVAQPEQWYTIASRPRNFITPDTAGGDAAIEAPFIFKKNNYYYLFASFDYCCRGEKSTYKIVVGRSAKLQGPYVDQEGVAMNLGGGSIVLEGDANWNGVGHNAVASFDGTDYLIFHGYDAKDKGRSKLRMEKLKWVNGWPQVEKQGE
ncbi:arabinan endo-1,5-alpha-L-arabinosidase [Terrimonas pollutisoli]|uniref:arabinan endo-1,5-alpha-L-arabinosidase n=1 Tax=Terrimonas pollutisoli TaxID=3034147 RepID=UPI0023EABE8A|nr:arabinan endo-1,5-alpha-L-arabinosidase [Terrimonas sp. H1YJ31]